MSQSTLRVALASWEIGRAQSGFGARVGGLGVVVEQLPPELLLAAARRGMELELRILSPCFAWYDRGALERIPVELSSRVDGRALRFTAYRKRVRQQIELPDGSVEVEQELVYFWEPSLLGGTTPGAIYPSDSWRAALLYAGTCQAMAAYLQAFPCDTLHLHDYHVGLVPFFLPSSPVVPVHLTVHNGSYQGSTPLQDGGYETLERLGLPGAALFHRYFHHDEAINLLKAAMLAVHERGGRVTTVSGDLEGSWGYAAELRASHAALTERATQQLGREPTRVFLPNGGLDLFERIPVAGITNGMGPQSRPENLPELCAEHLRRLQASRPERPIFANAEVQRCMLDVDHRFDPGHLERKAELKRLLHLECFGSEPEGDPPVLVVVGRLAAQKHLDLVLAIVEPVLESVPEARFAVLASAADPQGLALERAFAAKASRHPDRFFYDNRFHQPLSRLMMAGADFALVPSRFEPCGLVDYEASLLGTVVIARRTGGLAKMERCGYLYDWLDEGDEAGEARAFSAIVLHALEARRDRPWDHRSKLRASMAIDAGWERSADQYLDLYQHGLQAATWRERRRDLLERFARDLGEDAERFARYFQPAVEPYADPLDWELFHHLRDRG